MPTQMNRGPHHVEAECARCQAIEVRSEEHLEAIQEIEQKTNESDINMMKAYGFTMLCSSCRRELSPQFLELVTALSSMTSAVVGDLTSEIRYYTKRYGRPPVDLTTGLANAKSKVATLRTIRDWHYRFMKSWDEEE